MLYLDDLKYMKLYKKKFYLPINKKDKRKGSPVIPIARTSINADLPDPLEF